jgi:hypothetical protein
LLLSLRDRGNEEAGTSIPCSASQRANRAAIEVPRGKLCCASLATGLMLGGIVLAAMRIDVLSNYHYGVWISRELAGVMVWRRAVFGRLDRASLAEAMSRSSEGVQRRCTTPESDCRNRHG